MLITAPLLRVSTSCSTGGQHLEHETAAAVKGLPRAMTPCMSTGTLDCAANQCDGHILQGRHKLAGAEDDAVLGSSCF